jgi:hypothetical protein
LDRCVKITILIEIVTLCGGEILLFWFCEGLACVSGKTKCAKCGLAENYFLKCGWAKIFKPIVVACVSPSWSVSSCGRLKSLVRMSKVDGFVVTLIGVVSSNRLAYNGLGIAEGGDY